MDDKKRSPRILIVDDLPDNIEVLANALGEEYEINISTSGASALELIERQKPDLILLDIMMPGMSGFELMESLKSSARHFTIPVIFVTAIIDAESETEALDAGAADFIHKPINPPVVRARVRHQLELGQYRTHLETLVQARTQALAGERDRAEAASRAKSAFLANMGHELRTPLHQVFGLSDLLARKMADEAAVKYLGLIKESSQHLLGLLTGLMDIAQLEANSLKLESQNFDLGALLENVTEPVRQVAAAKGLVFQCVGDICPQTILYGDPRILKRILEQLLSNSIKFSERGAVTLDTKVEPGNYGKVALRFAISDEGIGMTPQVKEGLFQLFNQGDNSMTRRFGGTGSGLLLCKRLLELMNGELHYESESGKGTTFSVSLQLGVGDGAAFGANQTKETRANQFIAQMAPLLAKENPDALMLWHDNRDWLQPALGATFEAFEKAICFFEFGVARKLLSEIAEDLLH